MLCGIWACFTRLKHIFKITHKVATVCNCWPSKCHHKYRVSQKKFTLGQNQIKQHDFLEPIFRILEATVTEKLNCFKFVCYTVVNSSIIKMITVTKPNHLQSPKRCQKISQVRLSKVVGDLTPKNDSVKHSIKFCLGSQTKIPKKRSLWFFF